MASNEQASTGSGFFGALKKVAAPFVGFEEKDEQSTPTPTFKAAVAKPAATSAAQAITRQYDPDMLQTLGKVVMNRKTPYTALLEASAKLEKVVPDETMRVKAAFATLGDRAPGDVIQAIDVHILDLEGERGRFKQASDRNVATQAGAARASAKAKQTQVDANAERIAKMQSDIAALLESNRVLSQEATDLSAKADAAEAEIQRVEDNFNMTVEFLKADLAGKKAELGALLS